MQARWNKQQMGPRTGYNGQRSPAGPIMEIRSNHLVDYQPLQICRTIGGLDPCQEECW